MGMRAPDLLETRAGEPKQRVIHAHERLAHDPEHPGVQEQVVRLVHRPGLRVLQGHHPEGSLAARDPREHEPDGVTGQRLGIRE